MDTNPPTTLKCGSNKCINTLRPLYLLLFECCSEGMEGNSRCLIQLALGDICACAPWQHHLLPDLLGPTMAKKLCAKCLHRDKHTTQNPRAFLMENKKIKRRRVMESTWGQFVCALKAFFAVKGWFSSTLPHDEHPTQREMDLSDRFVSWV